MKKWLILMLLIVFMLCGCATLERLYEVGKDGLVSSEGVQARAGATAIAQPIVGDPWAGIIGSIVGLLAGGFAVWKRKKWLDTPVNK